MTEDATPPTEGATEAAAGQDQQPRLRMLTQVARRIGFENIAMIEGRASQGRPNINVQVNVTAQPIAGPRHIVAIGFDVRAIETSEDGKENEVFALDLDYAGVVELENAKPELVEPILKIDAPRLMFPFARRIIAETVRDGGFPPLMLDPLNFAQLYLQQRQQAAAQAQQANGAEKTEEAPETSET